MVAHRYHARELAGNHDLPFADDARFHTTPVEDFLGLMHPYDKNTTLPEWIAFKKQKAAATPTKEPDVEAIRKEVVAAHVKEFETKLAKARADAAQEARATLLAELQAMRDNIEREAESSLWTDLATILSEDEHAMANGMDSDVIVRWKASVDELRARRADSNDNLFTLSTQDTTVSQQEISEPTDTQPNLEQEATQPTDTERGPRTPEAASPMSVDPPRTPSPPPSNQQALSGDPVEPAMATKRNRSLSQTSSKLETSPKIRKKPRQTGDDDATSPLSPTSSSPPEHDSEASSSADVRPTTGGKTIMPQRE